jgi:Prokaryotic homologs of the JAB domain
MTGFDLPVEVARAVARTVREAGKTVGETGGFLLGSEGSGAVNVLALTGHHGITRQRDLFTISGAALATLFEWADEGSLTILAQWHSHGRGAFLSRTDLKYGLNIPGFHSAVVPFYENPSSDFLDWGWWTYDGGRWIVSNPARQVTNDKFVQVTFDEEGVS